VSWDSIVFTCDYFCVETLHGWCAEGGQLSDHFVEDAPQTPHITLEVVWLILPHFWWAVVGSTGLSSEKSLFGHFTHVEVTKFNDAGLGQEQVRTLDVSVANFQIVESFETPNDLNEVVPDLVLSHLLSSALFSIDQLEHITSIRVLHDDAKTVGRILKKGFLVPNHVGVIDWGENSHFVEGILFLFATQFLQFNFFHSVCRIVRLTQHQVYLAEGALPYKATILVLRVDYLVSFGRRSPLKWLWSFKFMFAFVWSGVC